MDDYIQMGPNALFAAVVLSPAWGSQYRQADGPARHERSRQAALLDNSADGETMRAAGEQGSEQIAFL